ncbi:hypothetical protein Acor_51780 [Acrocarpospora corrugata]|uniref:Uncharacterized protein n=1 Tax=Acrocarpospora corrugata TaxID=35763 RepID=A0A5M3W501_9ACTN|nr:hypothetical protein Acor_51780 [Acrocarpospora corrugata]
MARTFFATIQNKLVYAVTGRTAAELIVERADAAEPNMGLTSWKGGQVRKADVTVSKNYLDSDEIGMLNMLTTQFLDFGELRARRRQQITMAEWVAATERFIDMNDMDVLAGRGGFPARTPPPSHTTGSPVSRPSAAPWRPPARTRRRKRNCGGCWPETMTTV